MKELFIYRGLPGSGKTTRAKELQKNTGGRIVGRDHLRELLYGLTDYKPSNAKEQAVTKLQEQMIRDGLRADQKVIVDDMNLKAKYVRRFMEIAREEGAEFSVIDLTNVDIDQCHLWNMQRERQVPINVIEDLSARFIQGKPYPLPLPKLPEKGSQGLVEYVPPQGAPRAIIVDIDGTVALMGDRDPYDYTRVHEDEENRPVVEVVWRMYQSGFKILFTSGRSDECRQATVEWICNQLGFSNFELFMRNAGDYRRDAVVKAELFDKFIRHEYDVRFVLDDRQQVVDMWRSLGLTCLQVAPGDF